MSTPTSEFFQRLIALGYPESVARRIASGDLVMDYASRMQRAGEQGYDPRTYYHGGAPNLLSIDPTVSSSRKTEGTGTWFSDMPEVANSYLSKDSQLYPVRINTQGMDMIDAEGAGWASLPSKNLMRDGAQKYPYPDDHTLSSDVMANMAREGGRAGLVIDNVVDLGPNVRMPKQINDDWRQWLLDYEQKGGRSVSVQDPNRVRSVNAAFDPEYVGPNILGNADPQLLAGIGTAGLLGAALFPQDAEAATGYKLFRQVEDKLYPLFVNRNKEVPVGEWLRAEAGEMTADGKVKSSLGPLAYRAGWHAGDLPIATHIGGKSGPVKQPNYRPADQVWAEVEFPEEVDWQSIANANAKRNKAGEIIPRTAQITDQVPYNGFYRYKTNPNMTGEWMIGGDMKVNRVLSDEEVKAINDAAGVADLPRLQSIKTKDVLGNANPMLLASLAGGSLLGAAVAPKAKSEETKEVDPFVQALMDYTSDANFLPSPSERLIPMSEIPAEMKANNPDLIRDITNWAGNAMGGDYYDYRAAEGLMNVADFAPYIGGGISLQQGADAYRNNRKWEGRLLTGLGLLEVIPYLGRMASESIVPAVRPTMKKWDESDSLLRLLEQQ